MSFLLNNYQPEPAVKIAAQLKTDAKFLYGHMVTAFNKGSKLFWQNAQATPTEIAAALGTDAVEVFSLHAKLGALLAEVNPAAIVEGAAVVGQFEYNENGTVTVVESQTFTDDGDE
jgi:hypothetical protein